MLGPAPRRIRDPTQCEGLPDRHQPEPDAGPLKLVNSLGPARPARHPMPCVILCGTSVAVSPDLDVWWAPSQQQLCRGPVTSSAWTSGPLQPLLPSSPVDPPRSPHGTPVGSRGGLVRGSSSGGLGNWLTTSAACPTHPPDPFPRRGGLQQPRPPPPPPGGARKSEQEDQFLGTPRWCPAGLSF